MQSCGDRIAVGLLLAAIAGTAARADVKFTRLDADQFVISHRKQTLLGAEAKAMKTLYGEVASICVAAGFKYFDVKSQDVQERQQGGLWGGGRGASGTVEAKFHQDKINDDVIECQPLSDPKKVDLAKKKLEKM
jgi:hypothetical protein